MLERQLLVCGLRDQLEKLVVVSIHLGNFYSKLQGHHLQVSSFFLLLVVTDDGLA